MPELAVETLTREAARALTEEVKTDAAALWAKLLTLYEGKAHNALGYTSWGAYYEQEFGRSPVRGEQLLRAARVMGALETAGNTTVFPANEAVARQLVPVLSTEGAEAAAETWEAAVEQHGGRPTAAEVRAIVDDRKEDMGTDVALSNRDQMRANAHKRRVVETVSYLRGLATGLGTLDVQRAVAAMEPGEAVEWAKELDRAITRLRALRRDLENHA